MRDRTGADDDDVSSGASVNSSISSYVGGYGHTKPGSDSNISAVAATEVLGFAVGSKSAEIGDCSGTCSACIDRTGDNFDISTITACHRATEIGRNRRIVQVDSASGDNPYIATICGESSYTDTSG